MQNIVVKNSANADVTYVAVAAASSDGVKAVYEQQAGFATPAERPRFTLLTRDNASKTSRRLVSGFEWPLFVTPAGSSVKQRAGGIPGEFSMILPRNIAGTTVLEAFDQYVNLLRSAVVRAVAENGYAPR